MSIDNRLLPAPALALPPTAGEFLVVQIKSDPVHLGDNGKSQPGLSRHFSEMRPVVLDVSRRMQGGSTGPPLPLVLGLVGRRSGEVPGNFCRSREMHLGRRAEVDASSILAFHPSNASGAQREMRRAPAVIEKAAYSITCRIILNPSTSRNSQDLSVVCVRSMIVSGSRYHPTHV